MEVVEGPRLRPPSVGLLVSANPVTESSNRWGAGLEYQPEACGGGSRFAPCSAHEKIIGDSPSNVSYRPFGVWTGEQCSTFGSDLQRLRERSARALEACQSAQIARELWHGEIRDAEGWPNRALVDVEDDAILTGDPGTPASPADALAFLEQGLADCGCGAVGMIHATRATVTLWQSLNLIRQVGNLRLTTLDTIVVPDAGYDGAGPGHSEETPNPAADGSVWAYGTGIVDVRLGSVLTTPETLDQAYRSGFDNVFEIRSERMAAATFDPCCHVAVEIDVPLRVPAEPVGS